MATKLSKQSNGTVEGVKVTVYEVDANGEKVKAIDVSGVLTLLQKRNKKLNKLQAQMAASNHCLELMRIPIKKDSKVSKALFELESVLAYYKRYTPRGTKNVLAPRRWLVKGATPEQMEKVKQFLGAEVVVVDWTEWNRKHQTGTGKSKAKKSAK